MAQPLMPKATAVWLVDNTALTFDQIADYCGLHILEVQAIADGEVAPGMQGLDPIANGQVSKAQIEKCEADPDARLEMSKPSVPLPKVRQKGARYTPISKRQDRPDAIAWLLKSYPELSDAQVSRLIGTTKPTIESVRARTHRNIANIKAQSPVYLGLCSAADLEKIVAIARKRAGTEHAPAQQPPAEAAETAQPAGETAGTESHPAAAVAPAAEIFGDVPAAAPAEDSGDTPDPFAPQPPTAND